ncbi:hydroxyethylthiazole kinase [Clostridium sp. BJN0001]|uniref:hydroxyethylthiazole kinase n=1 Tax=Clostridium sp. BJN0001 TaxID=2930219 RepID=UPI001FD56D57|nr:hydroxyethylthiazole kinase [Clostridium sp. BJN0001]
MSKYTIEDGKEIFENIQKIKPLVHNISNIVTANDCANMTLACGGSPTMADDPDEVEEITAECNGFVLNMGNTGGYHEETMLRAGKMNNKVNHPLLLDPVGAGAAKRRNAVLKNLLNNIHFSVIRGNVSEIKFVGGQSSGAKGVDADILDLANEDNIKSIAEYAKELSKKMNTVIVISGPIDVVAFKDDVCIIRNGHKMMSKITGTGCMQSSEIGVFIAANKDNIYKAVVTAVSAYGYAGELAYKKMAETDGSFSTLRMHLIDYMAKMNYELFKEGAKIEVL